MITIIKKKSEARNQREERGNKVKIKREINKNCLFARLATKERVGERTLKRKKTSRGIYNNVI